MMDITSECADYPAVDKQIARICRQIQFKDANSIQIIINKHLAAVTKVEVSFLAFALPSVDVDEQGLTVSVVGERVLPSPVQIWRKECGMFISLNQDYTPPVDLEALSPGAQSSLSNLLDQRIITNCMLVPIMRPGNHQQLSLVVALVDKQEGLAFNSFDLQTVHQCFELVAGLLMLTLELETERRMRLQNQYLLAVTRNLFSHLDNVEVLLKEIMSEARQLTRAERCSLFLLDKERKCLVAKIWDLMETAGQADNQAQQQASFVEQQSPPGTNGKEFRIPADQGIAGHVAQTGQLLNIRDAYSHPLFYPDVDKSTGFQTRNILCIPIKNGEEVLGVAELCNKTDAPYFSTTDEELATSFAIYCGMSLVHGLMYKKVSDAQHRSNLSNELMMYHMKVPHEETFVLSREQINDVHNIDPKFCNFDFIPRSMSSLLGKRDETPSAVISIFEDLGMIERWSINRETLARFVLMVRKGYRDPPYHNWMHAFSVFHFSYLLIKRLELVQQGYLTELESLALLVSSLCHDVDHRGTTNSFQMASNSVLAALYSSEGSVMERHHFAQTMCILHTQGCNIFENLSSKEYTSSLDLLQEIILATDVAHHLITLQSVKDLVAVGYETKNPEHHHLLLYLLMTAADLSDQTKDWENSRKAALLVYKEFFKQGDLEKAMGNRPVEMMDRDKACIPALQIQFIDDVALPVYTSLSRLFPESKILVETVSSNRDRWVAFTDGSFATAAKEILTID